MRKRKLTRLSRNKSAEIHGLIKHERRDNILRTRLNKYHPYDLKEALLMMRHAERARLYDYLNEKTLADVFAHLPERKARELLNDVSVAYGAKLLEIMAPDDAVDILQSMRHKDAIEYMALIKHDHRNALRRLSSYKHHTVGSEMTSDFIALEPDTTVSEAFKALHENAEEVEAIDTLFIVDEANRLEGIVELKQLLDASKGSVLRDVMTDVYRFVFTEANIYDAVEMMDRYNLHVLPAINKKQSIEGVLTLTDAIDVVEESALADTDRYSGLPTGDAVFESASKHLKRRLPWFFVMMAWLFAASGLLFLLDAHFSDVWLFVAFLPFVLATSNHLTSQSLAQSIVKVRRHVLRPAGAKMRYFLEETTVTALTAVFLGALALLLAWGVSNVDPEALTGSLSSIEFAMIIAASVALSGLVASMLAAALPLWFRRRKTTPALFGAPMMHSISDFISVVIYVIIVLTFSTIT